MYLFSVMLNCRRMFDMNINRVLYIIIIIIDFKRIDKHKHGESTSSCDIVLRGKHPEIHW